MKANRVDKAEEHLVVSTDLRKLSPLRDKTKVETLVKADAPFKVSEF